MRALDTNVLARFLVGDDPAQYEIARTYLRLAAERAEPLLVTDVVLCELVWVLRRTYRQDRAAVAATIGDLLRATNLRFTDFDGVKDALAAFTRGRGDFADYLIRARALAAGCDAVVTFDRALHGEPGFAAPA